MTRSLKSGSFEDFVRWLAEARPGDGTEVPDPDPEVRSASREAWQQHQSLQSAQRQALAERVRAGTYVEALELMVAADTDRSRWLPRLRTPNGFAISALYATPSAPGVAPVGLLVECPADLIEIFKGQRVHVAAAGRWVEIGEIDVDGKAMGDLPEGFEFTPPFSFRIGTLAPQPAELQRPDEPA